MSEIRDTRRPTVNINILDRAAAVAPPGADLPQSEGPLCTIHPDQRTPCAMCLRAGIGTCPKCGKPSPAVDAYCSTCEKVVLRHVVPAVPGADLRAALLDAPKEKL